MFKKLLHNILYCVYGIFLVEFQLKRQLDYQVEVTKIDQRIKQQFMVKWVLNRVNESIGQASEKENLKQCIANLNALAARV